MVFCYHILFQLEGVSLFHKKFHRYSHWFIQISHQSKKVNYDNKHFQSENIFQFKCLQGTDSRIGFGYRLGDHADFQVQFEIGPQKETQAIGSSSAGKRELQPEDNFYVEKAVRKEKVRKHLPS